MSGFLLYSGRSGVSSGFESGGLSFGRSQILMLRLLRPVPGIPTDPRMPDSLAFRVSWNGPSLNDLENDCGPRSVKLMPAIVLSKLIALRLRVMMKRLDRVDCKLKLYCDGVS